MPLSLNRNPTYLARKPRYRVAFQSKIAIAGGPPIPVLVRDLSDDGFMAVGSVECPVDTDITIELPDLGAVQAKVRWVEEGCLGGRFVAALPAFPRPGNLDRRTGPRAEYPRLNLLREEFAAARKEPPLDEAAE